MRTKNPLTPAGIEPATYRLVAQRLNHCATVVTRIQEELNSNLTQVIMYHIWVFFYSNVGITRQNAGTFIK